MRDTSFVATAFRVGVSEGDYLAFERASEERHEYADGVVYAMSGGSGRHSALAANVIVELGVALRGGPCRPLTSDMRVLIPASRRYLYPDVSVVCGQPEMLDAFEDNLLNPRVVVEVLSDSTEAYDRGEKFAHYQKLLSLKHYVLVSQKEPRIEVFTREDDGWRLRNYGPTDRVALDSIGCTIEVDAMYAGVSLEPRREPPTS
jgi:Uma2 family endonuclease